MAMISPRDLYLREHPQLAQLVASGNRVAIRRFLVAHGGIATGWQRVMGATQPTLQDPKTPGKLAPGQQAPAAPASTTNTIDPTTGAQQDAYQFLTGEFAQYGLGDLAPTIWKYVTEGYSGDTIRLLLVDEPAYKKRFAANEARMKAGLKVLTPAEYLGLEETYREILQPLPKGFYDDNADFQKFIENGISAKQLSERVDGALTLARKTDSGYRSMLQDTYGIALSDGDIAAYFLDQNRSVTLLQKTVASAGISDAARRQGLDYSAARGDQLAELGVTGEAADQAYGNIAEATVAEGRAADAFDLAYTQTDAENELLTGSASAKRKREQVEGTFGAYNPQGATRAGKGANSRDTSSSY